MRTFIHSSIVILMTVILTGMILLNLAGCSEDTLTSPNSAADKVRSATPDELIANFALAYGGRDLEMYADLFHDDFVYTFDPVTAQNLGPAFEYFTREDELICAGNLFSGETVINSRGQTQPAILAIAFQHWECQGEWVIDAEGQMRGVFLGDILITRQASSSLRIQGQQVFTVTLTEDVFEVGGSGPYYQIIGWQDLSGH